MVALGVVFAEAGVEACVKHYAGVGHAYLDRIYVVVLPFFDGVDEAGHEVARASGIFELVAAGAHRQVKAGQVRLVVNGWHR